MGLWDYNSWHHFANGYLGVFSIFLTQGDHAELQSERLLKQILRTFSGWFLTEHPVNKNLISLNPEIIGSYMACIVFADLIE